MVKRHFGRCFLSGALVRLLRALSKRNRYFPSKGTPTACPTMARNSPTVAVAWCSWKTLRNSSSTRFRFCLRPPECKQRLLPTRHQHLLRNTLRCQHGWGVNAKRVAPAGSCRDSSRCADTLEHVSLRGCSCATHQDIVPIQVAVSRHASMESC